MVGSRVRRWRAWGGECRRRKGPVKHAGQKSGQLRPPPQPTPTASRLPQLSRPVLHRYSQYNHSLAPQLPGQHRYSPAIHSPNPPPHLGLPLRYPFKNQTCSARPLPSLFGYTRPVRSPRDPIPPSPPPPSAPMLPGPFRWPPRPLPSLQTPPSASRRGRPTLPQQARSAASPPSPVAPAETSWSSCPSSSGLGRLSRWFRAMEAAWLAPARSSAADCLARLPIDDPTAVCPRCGLTRGPFDADGDGCSACRGEDRPWSRLVRLGAYRPPLSGLVRRVKFSRDGVLGLGLGRRLGERLGQSLRLRFPGGPRPLPMLVPVPMGLVRRWSRGVDHAGLLALGVADSLHDLGAIRLRLLSRRHRPAQAALPRMARLTNLRSSMRPRVGSLQSIPLLGVRWKLVRALRRAHAAGRPAVIVLVDDVTTTNATLAEAARALRDGLRLALQPLPRPQRRALLANVHIWAAVAAVTDPNAARHADDHDVDPPLRFDSV